MSDNHEEIRENEPQITDLPDQEQTPQIADAVKGGAARRSGDDDLEDLEVERNR
jgi:hypothetical protein